MDDKELDDIIDEEEYKKAIAALESSKSIRLKENQDKKKAEAKAKKEALAAKRKEEAQKKIESSGIKNPFIAKCVTDPIIPICLVAALLAIVGILLYILIPIFSTPAMKFTLEEFKTKYTSTNIYTQSLYSFGFQIPDVTYIEAAPTETSSTVALTADPNALSQTSKSDSSNLLYFNGVIPNNASSLGVAIQGSCRKSDHKLTALRAMVEFSNSDDYYNFLLIFFSSYLQAFYPDLTSEQTLDLAQNAIADFQGTTFTIRGDYAYRVVMESSNGVPFFAIDFIPADSISK